MQQKLVRQLSNEFNSVLNGWLSPNQLEEINEKNGTADYHDGTCATHEYCDPNEAMLEAFKTVVGRDYDFELSIDAHLFEAAWQYSRINEFFYNAEIALP